MKQSIEQAAIAFAEKCRIANFKGGLDYPYDDLDMRNAFEAGAEFQAKQNPWISIDEQFPEDKQPVLCSSQIYGKVVLCYDELSQSWSYPESGEFYCDWNKVDCWMLIPEV